MRIDRRVQSYEDPCYDGWCVGIVCSEGGSGV